MIRLKTIPINTGKLLATAFPNPLYENILSLHDVILEVRLEDNKIQYFETHSRKKDWITKISEETVKALFTRDVIIKERPFLHSENKQFYTVLNRERSKYQSLYQKLLNEHK